MKKKILPLLAAGLLLAACGAEPEIPETLPPETIAVTEPLTEPPTTIPETEPETLPPETEPPVRELTDGEQAPAPNSDAYGIVNTPGEMAPILEQAEKLLEGQSLLFTADMELREDSEIHYYLDDSILVVTWKQVFDNCVYTISEVKIAHPSQLRRYITEDTYCSGIFRTTQDMAKQVNAVVASAGDFYHYRNTGVVVYNGQVLRSKGELLETLYVNEDGDFLFTAPREIADRQTAEQFVADNAVRFSVTFGPRMVSEGEYCAPFQYNIGEINDYFSRAAVCQLDKLHYLLITANSEHPYYHVPTISEFGHRLQAMGIPLAYTIDGGQTTTIVMNDEVINTVNYGGQRELSDIIYFATAVPNE